MPRGDLVESFQQPDRAVEIVEPPEFDACRCPGLGPALSSASERVGYHLRVLNGGQRLRPNRRSTFVAGDNRTEPVGSNLTAAHSGVFGGSPCRRSGARPQCSGPHVSTARITAVATTGATTPPG